MRQSSKGLLFVVLAAVFWSLAGLGISMVNASASAITGWRALFATPVFLLALAWRLRRLPVGTRTQPFRSRWVWGGAVCYLVTVVCFVTANKLVGAANAILLQYTSPVHVALLSWPLLKERPRLADVLAMSGCLVGMGFFFADDLTADGLAGNLYALVSGLGFAGLALCLRKASLVNTEMSESAALATTTLGNLLALAVTIPAMVGGVLPNPLELGVLSGLGVFQLGLAYVFYSAGVVHLRAVVAVVLVALEPILNPVWVALISGVFPSRSSLLGGGVILGSVVAYALHQAWKEQRDRRRKEAEAARSPGALVVLVALPLTGALAVGRAVPSFTALADAPPTSDCAGPQRTLEEFLAEEAIEGHAEGERLRVFDADPAVAYRGAAVVVHGLNLRPSRMDDIARLLSSNGYDVVRAALAGHGGNIDTYRKVTRSRWLEDMRFAVCHAKFRARESKPLVFVGYSLGALVTQDLVNGPAFTRSPFAAQVLLAPAISVRPFTHLVRTLSLFPGLVLPSLSLEEYRSWRGTTIASYSALFDSRAALLTSDMARSKIPTLVFVHADDELVSLSGLRALVGEKSLDTWTIATVDKAGHRHPRTVNHLIVDPPSFSPAEWKRVSARILEALP